MPIPYSRKVSDFEAPTNRVEWLVVLLEMTRDELIAVSNAPEESDTTGRREAAQMILKAAK